MLRSVLGSARRYVRWRCADWLGLIFPRIMLRFHNRRVYSYHTLGPGSRPPREERTPCGDAERYNFDRMYMMTSNYNFAGKSLVDLGCNSGWFCVQAKLLGAGMTVGIDYVNSGLLGSAIAYAIQFERVSRLGIRYVNANLEIVDFAALAREQGLNQFDAALLLSVLHHVHEKDPGKRARFFRGLYNAVRDVIVYEDHEFWNEILDGSGQPVAVKGEGYRYGWNEDMAWQRKMASIESHGERVIEAYRGTWRREVLMLDRYAEVRFLGFSEKRRPMLALFKHPVQTMSQAQNAS